jgi:ketosteroid isomerase-like protein
MTQSLKTVTDIYEAIEQGNIGKIISLLDENFTVYLPNSLGGAYHGHEGILDVVSKMCSSSTAAKKFVDTITQHDTKVIVLGNAKFRDFGATQRSVPFVDVWQMDGDKVNSVQVFYLNPETVRDYLANE